MTTLKPGFNLPPVSATGNPLYQNSIFTGPPGAKAISLVTPNLGDRTTWYQNAINVVETLTDSGDGLTFNSSNSYWIDINNEKLTYTYNQIPTRTGTFVGTSAWAANVLVNGVAATSGYTINFAAGTVTFAASQTGNTISANYWTNNGLAKPSEWLFNPGAGLLYTIECVELQYSMNMPTTMDTIVFEIWAGADLAHYQGNVASGATVPTSANIVTIPASANSTTTTSSFTQPSTGGTVAVNVASTSWMVASEPLFIYGGGFYAVAAILSSTQVLLLNLGYASFSQSIFSLGYGQFRASYRNVWDIINVTNNQSSTVIPAHGPMAHDIFIAPFDYTQAIQLNSLQGTLMRVYMLNDIPIADVEIATATFYLQIVQAPS